MTYKVGDRVKDKHGHSGTVKAVDVKLLAGLSGKVHSDGVTVYWDHGPRRTVLPKGLKREVQRECCNYCMWLGPVNQDGTMRKHRPTREGTVPGGRKVQDYTKPPCEGSNAPYARFGCA